MSEVIERFASKSSSNVYEVVLGRDGVAYCSIAGSGDVCPGWKFSKKRPKTCSHLERLIQRGVLGADYRPANASTAPPPKALFESQAEAKAIAGSMTPLKPMMAHQIDAAPYDPYTRDGWIAEVKYDGIRLIAHQTPTICRLFARSGNEHTGSYDFLKELTLPKDTVLDGELVSAGDASTWASGESRNDSVYVVFDVVRAAGCDFAGKPWTVRREALETIVASLAYPRMYASKVLGPAGRSMFDEVVAAGGEGLMLKREASTYQVGKRSWDWLKQKDTFEVDVVVMDMEALPTSEERKAAGWKGLRYGFVMPNGKLEVCGSLGVTGLPHELEPMIGKVAVVKCYGVSARGGIRHPLMLNLRDDKLPYECLLPVERVT